jgi:hypothetical protein
VLALTKRSAKAFKLEGGVAHGKKASGAHREEESTGDGGQEQQDREQILGLLARLQGTPQESTVSRAKHEKS